MNEKVIKIEYHSDEIERLKYIDGKSDWIDLRAAERVELKAGDFKLISLGVSMRIPEGYELWIFLIIPMMMCGKCLYMQREIR